MYKRQDLDDRNALLARYKSRLQSGQAAIFERYLAEADAPRLLHERCQLVDDLLRELWTELCFPQSLALLAVGGYGGGKLWPASDVDLLLLLPGMPDAMLTEKLEQLVGLFWDIGLEIGHSVRTVEELSLIHI